MGEEAEDDRNRSMGKEMGMRFGPEKKALILTISHMTFDYTNLNVSSFMIAIAWIRLRVFYGQWR